MEVQLYRRDDIRMNYWPYGDRVKDVPYMNSWKEAVEWLIDRSIIRSSGDYLMSYSNSGAVIQFSIEEVSSPQLRIKE